MLLANHAAVQWPSRVACFSLQLTLFLFLGQIHQDVIWCLPPSKEQLYTFVWVNWIQNLYADWWDKIEPPFQNVSIWVPHQFITISTSLYFFFTFTLSARQFIPFQWNSFSQGSKWLLRSYSRWFVILEFLDFLGVFLNIS